MADSKKLSDREWMRQVFKMFNDRLKRIEWKVDEVDRKVSEADVSISLLQDLIGD